MKALADTSAFVSLVGVLLLGWYGIVKVFGAVLFEVPSMFVSF